MLIPFRPILGLLINTLLHCATSIVPPLLSYPPLYHRCISLVPSSHCRRTFYTRRYLSSGPIGFPKTVSRSISILALNLFLAPLPSLDHCYHLCLNALQVALSLFSTVPPPLSLSPSPLLDLLLLLLPWLQYGARRHREPS